MIVSDEKLEELRVMLEAGLTPAEAENLTGVPVKEIRALKKKHNWKASAPSVAVREAELLDMAQAEAEVLTTKAADNGLKAAGTEYTNRLFGVLSAKMLTLKKLPPIKSWKDVKIIDDILRRAAGLDDNNGNGSGKVLINLGVIAGGKIPEAAKIPNQTNLIETTYDHVETQDNHPHDGGPEPILPAPAESGTP
jgi:hypothetical protein